MNPSRRTAAGALRSLGIKAAALLAAGAGTLAQAAPVGYAFEVDTFYQFGSPADLTYSDFGAGGPDTGYFRVKNTGITSFSGIVGQVAVACGGGDYSYSHALSLAPGASVVFAVNDESSNYGGFGGACGGPQTGVEIYITGLMEGVEGVDLHVFDRDIHSGVPVMNPFGDLIDSYVLQGGDSIGRDTGDDFEVAQAPGFLSFVERGTGPLPEPGSLALLGLALAGLGLRRRIAR